MTDDYANVQIGSLASSSISDSSSVEGSLAEDGRSVDTTDRTKHIPKSLSVDKNMDDMQKEPSEVSSL